MKTGPIIGLFMKLEVGRGCGMGGQIRIHMYAFLNIIPQLIHLVQMRHVSRRPCWGRAKQGVVVREEHCEERCEVHSN